MQAISLVIPHFNRYAMLLDCVQHVLDDPRIVEICISDDHSLDGSFEKLMKWAGKFWPKVSLYRSEQNRDCYFNKHRGVQLAKHDWVILFDDDNVMPTAYLDTLEDLPTWETDTVYCPEFAEPHFDYRAFSGITITRQNVASLMSRPHFTTALNTANYFFHRETWLGVWNNCSNPHTADSIYQAYRLLAAGKKLYITPGLQYFHRVHAGSHYKNNVHKTGLLTKQIEDKLRALK